MANWKAPRPRDNASERERGDFAREVWTRIKFGAFDWTPPSIAAADSVAFVAGEGSPDIDTRETIGLRVGMPIHVTAADGLNGLTMESFVSTDDQLDIVLTNATASPIVPPAGQWSFMGVVI